MFDLRSYLDQKGVRYRWSVHASTQSAQRLAAVEHVPGRRVVKPVLVSVDGQFVLCALPASMQVDLARLRMQLCAAELRLADEGDLASVCGDCDLGAQPPLGWVFGMPTVVDESLFEDGSVTFQAGTHTDAVTMRFLDYFRLAQPGVGRFGREVRDCAPAKLDRPGGQATAWG